METIQIVSFGLNENMFGVDIMKVQEIMRLVPITKIPTSASFISGIINVRGKIVPVIDTRIKLGIECCEATDESRLLLVDKGGTVAGLLVDEVAEVLTVNKEDIETFSEIDNDFGNESAVIGIAKLDNQMLTIINTDELLK